MGTLYYGECLHTATLDIRRRSIADESIDLVYLDPPFNSAQNYNAFFQEKDGSAVTSHHLSASLRLFRLFRLLTAL